VRVSGVTSLIVKNNGNVGIGTTSPEAFNKLEVETLYPDDNTHVIHANYTGGNYDAIAVWGRSAPQDNVGTGGYFEGGDEGVMGRVYPTGSATYYGVNGVVGGGSGTNVGVYGWAYGGSFDVGVIGQASGAGDLAGYFLGDVDVTGTLSKGGGAFKIDHPLDPENKYLYHSFVESPDMMNIYNGMVVLDDSGEALVELPEWFETVNRDFRYQLTPIGAPGPDLHISEEVSNNRFKISGGDPRMKVSWEVTGIRQDPWAEANRIPVEKLKPEQDKGKYIHPELYGMPMNMAIGYLGEEIMDNHSIEPNP
jgi:hypothetical protein